MVMLCGQSALPDGLYSALVFASGFILKLIVRHKKKHGFVEDEIVWEENDPEVEK